MNFLPRNNFRRYTQHTVQITVEQAVLEFGRLLEGVRQGEKFVIVQGDAPLALLSPVLLPRQPGSAVGIITCVAEDFDAPLEEFEATHHPE